MFKTDFERRIFQFFTIPVILLGFAWQTHASSVQIFDVHQNVAMNPTDPVYRDYYVSGGRSSGLRVNMIVPVVRVVPIYDSFNSIHRGNLKIKVGTLQIIQVGSQVSVGREVSLASRMDQPVLDYNAPMIGDTLDVSHGKMGKPLAWNKPAVSVNKNVVAQTTASVQTTALIQTTAPVQTNTLASNAPAPKAPPPQNVTVKKHLLARSITPAQAPSKALKPTLHQGPVRLGGEVPGSNMSAAASSSGNNPANVSTN